jgi:hypothetical protein
MPQAARWLSRGLASSGRTLTSRDNARAPAAVVMAENRVVEWREEPDRGFHVGIQ